MTEIWKKFFEDVKKFVEREAVEPEDVTSSGGTLVKRENKSVDNESVRKNLYNYRACYYMEIPKRGRKDKLRRFIEENEEKSSFDNTVQKLLKKYKLEAPDAYKASCLSRQKYAKAVDSRERNISKYTVWQIAIGIKCNLEEADELLASAGYVRRKNKFDLIMEYFITNRNFDIDEINLVLDAFGLKPFTCYVNVKDKHL